MFCHVPVRPFPAYTIPASGRGPSILKGIKLPGLFGPHGKQFSASQTHSLTMVRPSQSL